MSRRFILSVVLGFAFFLCLGLSAHGTTEVRGATEATLQPKTIPVVIWVADFGIDTANVQEQQGLLGVERPARRGPLGGGGVLRRQQDPEAKARSLVDLLSSSLTDELNKRSLPARRLASDQQMPDKGWLIQGQFLEVDEGNRVRRAVIGFGAGETHMQMEVTVTDMDAHPESPFLVFGTQSGSGKMPGAVVTMNPYVAAAKFVMSKNASRKDVKHIAGRVASELINYMKTRGLIRP